jgi:hypothetical protein
MSFSLCVISGTTSRFLYWYLIKLKIDSKGIPKTAPPGINQTSKACLSLLGSLTALGVATFTLPYLFNQ